MRETKQTIHYTILIRYKNFVYDNTDLVHDEFSTNAARWLYGLVG